MTFYPISMRSKSKVKFLSYSESLGRKLWRGFTARGPNTSSRISIFSTSSLVMSQKPRGSSATFVSTIFRLFLMPWSRWGDSRRRTIVCRIRGLRSWSSSSMIWFFPVRWIEQLIRISEVLSAYSCESLSGLRQIQDFSITLKSIHSCFPVWLIDILPRTRRQSSAIFE